MSKTSIFVVIVALFLIIGSFFFHPPSHQQNDVNSIGNEPSTSVTPGTGTIALATYTNPTYGFEIRYPMNLATSSEFKAYYALLESWRIGASDTGKGVKLVSIISKRIENENSYPRYFDAEVRVSASKDKADVTDCYKNDTGHDDTTVGEKVINGVTWKTFTLDDAAMMQYLAGTSYRTIHNGACVVMEHIKAGSSYRDDPKTPSDPTDAELNSYFDNLSGVVETFRFLP